MASKRPRARHLWLMALGAMSLVAGGVVIGFVILLSGAMDTSATTQHFLVTHRLLDLGLEYSVRTGARDIRAPSLDDPGMLAQGAACYSHHCAQCHGAPGTSPEAYALGMLPGPVNLAQTARTWPPEWLYFVIRKGIRMTGMPAWEFRLSDESLWATTAFLKQLPSLDRAGYERLVGLPGPECSPATGHVHPGDADTGPVVLRQYGCHGCHRIDGVVGPRSHVGPPLTDWKSRRYIAGTLPNTQANLVRWIRDPGAISPGTLMPDLGVPEAHAIAMARYLLEED